MTDGHGHICDNSLSKSKISSSSFLIKHEENTTKYRSYDKNDQICHLSPKKFFPNCSALFMNSLPKSSCKLVAPTVEALSWEPSRCALPFLASRDALALSTVTWDEVLDGWLFTWEVEGWEAWLRASWRLLGGEGKKGRKWVVESKGLGLVLLAHNVIRWAGYDV